jgi:hydrogenase expression/formation protein HypD
MKYSIEELLKGIRLLSEKTGDVTIMEVCGTHTASIHKYGIPSLLPPGVRLVSGPGCPVCVTAQEDIMTAVSIADREDVIFTCFGDMMRVPCEAGSLYSLYEKGRDVRLVTSPMDALLIASQNPGKQVVYFGIGFETTAPHTAALIESADKQNLSNLTVLNVHKTMPQAIQHLLQGQSRVSALLCPGHVAAVTGSDAFLFVPEQLHMPAAVAGFEGYDILAAILRIMDMLHSGKCDCVNMYPRAVTREGNRSAQKLLYEVMEPGDALWRGLGRIAQSGLHIRQRYASFDARRRFDIECSIGGEPKGCLCSRILRGEEIPPACMHYGKKCTPDHPVGPCMVSAEGCCAAYYRYREVSE